MIYAIIGIVAFVLGGVAGAAISVKMYKQYIKKTIGDVDEKAKQMLNQAVKESENKKREALLEAKEQIQKERREFDKEIKEARTEQNKLQRRVEQKEEKYDKMLETIEKKEETLDGKNKKADEKLQEIDQIKRSQHEMLQKISNFSQEEAKLYLLQRVEDEITHDVAIKIRDAQERTKNESDEKAREIISTVIGRVASDYVAETTVSTVHLPNDEIKGRIIGREGRNIRAMEQFFGADLIIDDTPETIIISCFDPRRREIARATLEKLVSDGRIHPGRIEEVYNKTVKEIDRIILESGQKAVFETGVLALNPEIIKILGRLKYRTSFGQNVLQHSIEVSLITGALAAELGIDPTQAKRAGLLHDIGKAIDRETDGSHVTAGVDILKKHRENPDIIHAVAAHHNDTEPKTMVAWLVQAADALSAARPGARRENIENYSKRLQKLEELATSFEGVDRAFAVQAGREVRVMVSPDMIDDDKMVVVARDLSKKIEQELDYPGQIKIQIIREKRHTEYAK